MKKLLMIFLLAISSVAFGQVQIPMWTTEKEQLENEKKEREAQQQAKQELKERESIRAKIQNDAVAQALNYVSGFGENADGLIAWTPTNRNHGNCIFNSWYAIRNIPSDVIDLNKGNPSAIQFFTQGDAYITRVDGLPQFTCHGCNGDRVQRAWALIYKECKGTRKAF